MSFRDIPYVPLFTQILKTYGKAAVQQLCKKFMGDETCGGLLK